MMGASYEKKEGDEVWPALDTRTSTFAPLPGGTVQTTMV
jgi:hypothetical protein